MFSLSSKGMLAAAWEGKLSAEGFNPGEEETISSSQDIYIPLLLSMRLAAANISSGRRGRHVANVPACGQRT